MNGLTRSVVLCWHYSSQGEAVGEAERLASVPEQDRAFYSDDEDNEDEDVEAKRKCVPLSSSSSSSSSSFPSSSLFFFSLSLSPM
jgi:hypothetical protein